MGLSFSVKEVYYKKKKKIQKKKLSTASRSELPAKEEKKGDKKKRTPVFTFEKVNLIYDSTLSANDWFWWLATTIKEER